MRHTFLPLTGALIALIACDGGPTQPPLHGEIYVLESIAGVSLPAPYAPNPEFSERIVADTFAFVDGESGIRRTKYEGDAEVLDEEFSYSTSGESISITFGCPINALCIAGPHLTGTRTNASIIITHSVVTRQPLALRRLFPPD